MIKLRDFQPTDSNALVAILNDGNVTKYLSARIPFPYTQQDAQWWITTGSKLGIIKAITIHGELIGCIGVNRGEFEYARSAELGYWLAKPHWGKGLITQAIKNFVDEVFTTTNINRIFASVFSGNAASMKVLVKCGFEAEAVHKQAIYKNNTFYNDHIFSKLKE